MQILPDWGACERRTLGGQIQSGPISYGGKMNRNGLAFVHVGFGGIIAAHRIIAVLAAESAPTRRLVRQAKEEGRAIDLTCGRKTKTVIVMDTGHIALAALHPGTIAGRLCELTNNGALTHGHDGE